MATVQRYLAFDLGAESGRAVVGELNGDRLKLKQLHRFRNGPVPVRDSIFWDVLRIWSEIMDGLRKYRAEFGPELDGLGLDTWGVDFGLLGADDVLLGNPYHYRDARTNGMIEAACEIVPRAEIFEYSGVQFMPLNTLFQLFSMARARAPALAAAERLLMMPDLFNFWLTGRKADEFSIATTTQFYNPRERDWARPLLERLGIPTKILGEIVPPGTVLEVLLKSVAEEVGVVQAPVIAPACHDTAAAVAAVPAEVDNYAYLSSGTWSLMGLEIKQPIITAEALKYNFTNEGGVCGTIRFLKNIMGLWLVQECRRTWARAGQSWEYDELTRMAEQAPAFACLVEPDHASFLSPGDMPAEIRKFCAATGQKPPADPGATVRCALESLALKYRWVLERLEELRGRKLEVIHIVGGGSQNTLLCQFAADATGRRVVTGPVEATAAGNVMMQALARGRVSSLEEARRIIRNSFEVVEYQPRDAAAWEEAYPRYLQISEAADRVI